MANQKRINDLKAVIQHLLPKYQADPRMLEDTVSSMADRDVNSSIIALSSDSLNTFKPTV